MKIELSTKTLRWLLQIAQGRNSGKSAQQSRKMSKDYSDIELDYLGIKGEYVVSEIYGTPFDAESYGAFGDTGEDALIGGMRCAVKTNHRLGGYLLIERWRDIEGMDALHLVDGPCIPRLHCVCSDLQPLEPQTWNYAGWITTEQFKAQSIPANWGLGPRRYCRQHQLTRSLMKKSEGTSWPSRSGLARSPEILLDICDR